MKQKRYYVYHKRTGILYKIMDRQWKARNAVAYDLHGDGFIVELDIHNWR